MHKPPHEDLDDDPNAAPTQIVDLRGQVPGIKGHFGEALFRDDQVFDFGAGEATAELSHDEAFRLNPKDTIASTIASIAIKEGMERTDVDMPVLRLLGLTQDDAELLAELERALTAKLEEVTSTTLESIEDEIRTIDSRLGVHLQKLPEFEVEVRTAILKDQELLRLLQIEYYVHSPQGLFRFLLARRPRFRSSRPPCIWKWNNIFREGKNVIALKQEIAQKKHDRLKAVLAAIRVTAVPDVGILKLGKGLLPSPIPKGMLRMARQKSEGDHTVGANDSFLLWALEHDHIRDPRFSDRKAKKEEKTTLERKRDNMRIATGYLVEALQTISRQKRRQLGMAEKDDV